MRNKKQNIESKNSEDEWYGLVTWYYINGNISSKKKFVYGVEHGIDESYCSDGELWYKSCWINGEEVYIEWYGDRNIIEFII